VIVFPLICEICNKQVHCSVQMADYCGFCKYRFKRKFWTILCFVSNICLILKPPLVKHYWSIFSFQDESKRCLESSKPPHSSESPASQSYIELLILLWQHYKPEYRTAMCRHVCSGIVIISLLNTNVHLLWRWNITYYIYPKCMMTIIYYYPPDKTHAIRWMYGSKSSMKPPPPTLVSYS
jgi:hypothetical protein